MLVNKKLQKAKTFWEHLTLALSNNWLLTVVLLAWLVAFFFASYTWLAVTAVVSLICLLADIHLSIKEKTNGNR